MSNSPDGFGFFEPMYSLHFFQRTTEYLTGNTMDCKQTGNLLRIVISPAGETPE